MTGSPLEVPPLEHPIWLSLVTGQLKTKFDFMATKVLLIRIMIDQERDASPDTQKRSVEELRTMFMKNLRNPRVQNDLRRILMEGKT